VRKKSEKSLQALHRLSFNGVSTLTLTLTIIIMKNTIQFQLTELDCLALLIRGLNENGVPYIISRDSDSVTIQVTNGF